MCGFGHTNDNMSSTFSKNLHQPVLEVLDLHAVIMVSVMRIISAMGPAHVTVGFMEWLVNSAQTVAMDPTAKVLIQ